MTYQNPEWLSDGGWNEFTGDLAIQKQYTGSVAELFIHKIGQNFHSLDDIDYEHLLDFDQLCKRDGVILAPQLSDDAGVNLERIFSTERNTIKLNVAARIILRGDADYSIDVQGTAEQVLYNLRKRNGYNPHVSDQHEEAVRRSGSRYEQLKKLASVLPNAKTKWFENMGHDIPPILYDSLIAELIQNFERNPN